jgi:Tfp pilus assembly PilM family ATPase
LTKSLGISLTSNKIKFTELTFDSGIIRLTYADIVEVDFDFEDDLWKYKSNQKVLTNLADEIQKVLHKRGTYFSDISVAISTAQSFLIILPLDSSEGKSSLNSKIYWELSNYFPDNYNDFIVNTYRLNSFLPSSSTDEYLVMAIQKNTLEFLKRIFKLSNISVKLIDIDHFSAENALRKNNPHMLQGKNILLVGLKKNRFDFGFIQNKKYTFFAFARNDSPSAYNLTLTRKLKSFLNTGRGKEGVDAVYLYGDDIGVDTIGSLRKINGFKVETMNPFENIHASTEYLQDEKLRKVQYNFAPSCGVALRNL